MGWREDIGVIREIVTGTPSEGWRADIYAIARAEGYNPRSWREAVYTFAESLGAAGIGWRQNIQGMAAEFGKETAEGWRKDLKYIREYYESGTGEVYRLLDSEGYALNDSLGYALYVRR